MPTHAGRYVLGDGAWDRIDQDAASPDDAPAAVEPTELVLAIPPAIAPVPQPED